MAMKITDNHSILEYQKNNLINHKNVHNLLKITKEIVLDNKKFKNYRDSHMNLTQELSFKLPEITNYPLMKNEEIVALRGRSVKSRENTVPIIGHDNQNLDDLHFAEKFGFQPNKTKAIFFEKNSTYFNKTFNGAHRNILKSFLNAEGINYDNNLESNNRIKNIFDMNLIYDPELNIKQFNLEKEIFNKFYQAENFEEIQKFLVDKIHEIINGRNENITTEKAKVFSATYKESDYQVNLKCESLHVKFVPKDTSEIGNAICFTLPFTILPIFYFVDSFIFKLLLSKILKFDTEFKQISIDLENFRQTIYELSSLILNNNEIHKESILLNKNKNAKIRIDWITPKCVYEMTVYPPRLEFMIGLRNEKFYNFSETEFNLEKFCSVAKSIEKELLIYILQNNFVQWDFFLINYIVRFKNFRSIISDYLNILKRNKNKKIKFLVNRFDLDTTTTALNGKGLFHLNYSLADHIKSSSSVDSNFNIINNLSIQKDSESRIVLTDASSKSTSKNIPSKNKLSSYEFIVSFLKDFEYSTSNAYQMISPHRIDVVLQSGNVKKEFNFSLNFEQMKCLELIKKLPPTQFENYMKLIVTIDYSKRTVDVNYKVLDSIQDIIDRRIKLGKVILENMNNSNVLEDSVANFSSVISIK